MHFGAPYNRFESKLDGSQLYGERHNLYNGNIGLMVNTITNPSNMSAVSVGNAYVHDQLNRISESRSFANLNSGTNTWEAGSTYNGMYENNFTYDGNGNIERQLRSDEGGAIIDSLTYKYENGQYGRKRNRLYHVKDNVSDGEHEDDIDDMGLYTSDAASIATANNYRYDALGQLVYDRQEEISEIRWRNDGKIDAIIREGSSLEKDLGFTYDPSGNRLSKSIYGPGGAEYVNYYIRDAQGNVMAMYKMKYDPDNQTASYSVAERHIYGSDRLGMYAHEETVYPLTPASRVPFQPLWRGHRQYELKNHLGNVTSVVNGHKVAVASTGVIDHYNAQIVAAYDYSPFGVIRKSFEPDYTAASSGDTNPLAADFRWCMDGGGTEANGTGHDAALYSITNTADRNAEADKALRSNGASGSYMEIADDASFDFGSNDFTVGIWVRKEAAPTSTVNVIAVGKWNTDTQMATNEWCLNVARSSGTARPPQFRIAVGGTVYTAQGNSTLSNSWHHLVGVREGTNIKFYINGTLVQTTSVGTGAVNNVGRKIRIGRSEGPLRTKARFDEFVIYQHALSAGEISDLYTSTCEDLEGLPSEEIAGAGYSYSFQGQEADDEIKGQGNSINYKYRMHDPRIGRFFAVDPLFREYPWNSPYAFSENRVIDGVELEGLEYASVKDGSTTSVGPIDESKLHTDGNTYVETIDLNSNNIHDAYLPVVDIFDSRDSDKVIAHATQNSGSSSDPSRQTISPMSNSPLLQDVNNQMQKQQMLSSAIKRHQMLDPVMSGYFGGANQYPTLVEGMNFIAGPEAVAMSSIRFGTKATLGMKIWNNQKALIQRVDGAFVIYETVSTVRDVTNLVISDSQDAEQVEIQKASSNGQ